MTQSNKNKILASFLSGKVAKKYQGKQVLIVGKKIYILPANDQKAADFVNNLLAKTPQITPTITFVPKQGMTFPH